MSISAVTSPPPDLTRIGLAGFQDAQATLQDAADAVASGNADPAIILDVKSAEVTAGVSAALIKADQQNFQRLLDILA